MDRNTQICIEQIRDVLDGLGIITPKWQAIKPELGAKRYVERCGVGRRYYDGKFLTERRGVSNRRKKS